LLKARGSVTRREKSISLSKNTFSVSIQTGVFEPWQGLPDLSRYNKPKKRKIYQVTNKFQKWPYNLRNGHYICFLTFSISRPSKIYPNWDFWFENIPSDNPSPGGVVS
jgi:hypothetical protein